MDPSTVEGEEQVGKVVGHVGTAGKEVPTVEEECGCGPWRNAKLKLSKTSYSYG